MLLSPSLFTNTDSNITVGPLSINASDHTVRLNGQILPLTHLEFELLRLFALNPEKTITRERIMREVWGYDYVGKSRNIDVHILNLRRKLKGEGIIIETVRGAGYRMMMT